MQPLFFGTSGRRLFGAYHAAQGARGRSPAVVLCQPFGHEYLRGHRAFRNLAIAIAERGRHVIRFDYFGTGDSAGASDEHTVEQSLADIAAAIEEVKDISEATEVTLVGLRLGATLAMLAASGRRDVDRVILWDPVIAGDAHLDSLASLQQEWLEDRMGRQAANIGDAELIGFPMTAGMRSQLMATRIAPPPTLRARRVDLFVSSDDPAYRSLQASLEGAHVQVGYHVEPGAGVWDRGDLVHQILLPHTMVRAIASAVSP
jgi:pimeloyl-ACP methyl ester carboxylesterase